MSSAPRRNRLFDLEIDEVSSVDRPANQGGLIVIAKALGQEGAVPEDQLSFEIPADVEHGDTVIGADGSEFVYLEVGEDGEPLPIEGMDTAALVADADQVYDLSDDQEYELED